jgi:large subunit ribosomal protein L21
MYAIVKTGGKQYRVEQGQSLLVERLPVEDGGKFKLEPLLYVDGSVLVDGDELSKVTVEAKVLAHERGPKLRIVKFKPKRGYRRRNGHRQELTRIEVTSLKLGSRRAPEKATAEPAEAAGATDAPSSAEAAGAGKQTSKEAGNGA